MLPVGDILLYDLRNLSRESVGLPREECRKNLQRNEKPRNEEGRLPILWFKKKKKKHPKSTLGIFKNWASGIESQSNLFNFPKIGL